MRWQRVLWASQRPMSHMVPATTKPKMVIELKDKAVAVLGGSSETLDVTNSQDSVWRNQVSEGLVNLGYNVRDAEKACDLVAHLVDDNPDISVPAVGMLMRRSSLTWVSKPMMMNSVVPMPKAPAARARRESGMEMSFSSGEKGVLCTVASAPGFV